MRRPFPILLSALTFFQLVNGRPHERNSFLEYCSSENPGDEKVCRDVQAMKDFTDKQLRINGAFIIYNKEKIFENIVFGWGQCLDRPLSSYVKLLPWGMWFKALSLPYVVVVSDTIDLFTSYADQPAEIPLAGGKTHVFVLNGELRSFRGDIHRRCVAALPELRGLTEYHFEDRSGSDPRTQYTLTNKDKIFLGKDELQECAQYAKMDEKRDLFKRDTKPNMFPSLLERCKLDCTPADISIIRARNGTGMVELDEDAGLPGLLVLYAMNETSLKFSENRLYPPTFGGMLTSMYDTEVEVGEFLRSSKPLPMEALPVTDADDGPPPEQQGRSIVTKRIRQRRDAEIQLHELPETDDGMEDQKRSKRLTYSSAVLMLNSFGDGEVVE